MVVAGFGNGLTFPMTVLIVQRYTADRLRGRAFTLIISAHNAAARDRDGRRRARSPRSSGARWTYVVAAALLGAGGVRRARARRAAITAEAGVARQQAA